MLQICVVAVVSCRRRGSGDRLHDYDREMAGSGPRGGRGEDQPPSEEGPKERLDAPVVGWMSLVVAWNFGEQSARARDVVPVVELEGGGMSRGGEEGEGHWV